MKEIGEDVMICLKKMNNLFLLENNTFSIVNYT